MVKQHTNLTSLQTQFNFKPIPSPKISKQKQMDEHWRPVQRPSFKSVFKLSA